MATSNSIQDFVWASDNPHETPPAEQPQADAPNPWASDLPVSENRKAVDRAREARRRDSEDLLCGFGVVVLVAAAIGFLFLPQWILSSVSIVTIGLVWWIVSASNQRKRHRQRMEDLAEEQNRLLREQKEA